MVSTSPLLGMTVPDFAGAADVRTLLADLAVVEQSIGEVQSVRRHGALGDGLADDAAAFQAAVDAAVADGGGTVLVPRGAYKMGASVLVAGADVTVELAAGALVDISAVAGAGTGGVHDTVNVLAAFHVTGARFTLRGSGRIKASGSASTADASKNTVGVLIDGATTARVRDVKIDTCYCGIWAGGGATDVLLSGVEVASCARNILLGFFPAAAPNPQVTRVVLAGVVSRGATNDGLKMAAHARSVQVLGGHFYQNGADGIDCYVAGEYFSVVGVHCTGNGLNGLDAKYATQTGEGAGPDQLGYNRRFVVMGCVMRDNAGIGIDVELQDHVAFAGIGGVEGVVIEGNVVETSGNFGFALGLVRSVVRGNIARANALSGFRLKSLQDCVVDGNQSWDSGTAGVNREGFAFGLANTSGAAPISTRVLFCHNVSGDTRSGAARTQSYGFDLISLENSTVVGNVAQNNKTAGFTLDPTVTTNRLLNNLGDSAFTEPLGATLARLYSGTVTWDPPSLAVGDYDTVTVAVRGAQLGDPVAVGFSQDLQGMQLTGYVAAAHNVTVVLRNGTPGALDLASGTVRATVFQH